MENRFMHIYITVVQGSKDRLVWKGVRSGKFSIKSCFLSLISETSKKFPANKIWNSCNPLRVFS